MERSIEDLQQGYNSVAADYAELYFHELEHKPFDRDQLNCFITEVKGRGTACDMGCGPGEVARYLYDHGLEDVIGVDLASGMVRQASQLSPMIRFYQGDMLALGFPDQAWAGIAAFYSIIHIPRGQVVETLRELKRVLIPGGLLLLAVHVDQGESMVHLRDFFDKPVSLDFVFFNPDEMEGYLDKAGFERIEVFQRPPYPEVEYQGPRAYIFGRKPQ
jgi:SAM-dependent methyltransferase